MSALLKFDWDEAKNRSNIQKHGVSFEQARAIFNGPRWSRIDRRFPYSETREISIGLLEETAVVVVVHTARNGTIRIISARPANRKERNRFYEELRKASDG